MPNEGKLNFLCVAFLLRSSRLAFSLTCLLPLRSRVCVFNDVFVDFCQGVRDVLDLVFVAFWAMCLWIFTRCVRGFFVEEFVIFLLTCSWPFGRRVCVFLGDVFVVFSLTCSWLFRLSVCVFLGDGFVAFSLTCSWLFRLSVCGFLVDGSAFLLTSLCVDFSATCL